MSDEKSKKILITLKPDILEELDKMADEWGTSRSGMIAILTKLRKEQEILMQDKITKSVV